MESGIKVKVKHFSTLEVGVFKIPPQHEFYRPVTPLSRIFPLWNRSMVFVVIKNAVWQ